MDFSACIALSCAGSLILSAPFTSRPPLSTMPPKRTASKRKTASQAAAARKKTKKAPAAAPALDLVSRADLTKKKRAKKTYHLVVLGNGDWKQFDNVADFDEFMADYGDNVKAKHQFTAKKQLTDKITEVKAGKAAAVAAVAAASVGSVAIKIERGVGDSIGQDLTSNQKASAEKIIRAFRENSPSDRVELIWRTTSSSKKLLVIILILDSSGKLKWWFKGMAFAQLLGHYVRDADIPDQVLRDALSNVAWGFRRDPAGDSNDILQDIMKRRVTNKGGKTTWEPTGTTLDVTIPFTCIDIPVDTFTSKVEETVWIETTLKTLAQSLVDLHKDCVYKTVLQGTVTPAQWFAMTTPSRPGTQTYDQFFDTCVTRVTLCENLNTMLTRSSVADAMQVLLDNTMPNYGKKYPGLLDIVEVGDESSDDSSGDEGQEENGVNEGGEHDDGDDDGHHAGANSSTQDEQEIKDNDADAD